MRGVEQRTRSARVAEVAIEQLCRAAVACDCIGGRARGLLRLSITDRRMDLVAENVDVAVRIGEPESSELVATPLGRARRITAAAPGWIERHGAPRHPDELERRQPIAYRFARTGRSYAWVFERDGERVELVPTGRVDFDDLDAYVEAGCRGLGYVHALAFQCAPAVVAGRLVPVLEDWCAPGPPIAALRPARRHAGARVTAFVEWMRGLFVDGGA